MMLCISATFANETRETNLGVKDSQHKVGKNPSLMEKEIVLHKIKESLTSKRFLITCALIVSIAFILLFVNNDRYKARKLIKHDWLVNTPLKVFPNGDILLAHKKSHQGKLQIMLFNKKYAKTTNQPFIAQETITRNFGVFHIIKDVNTGLFGMWNEKLDMVLDINWEEIKIFPNNPIVYAKNDTETRTFNVNTGKIIDK